MDARFLRHIPKFVAAKIAQQAAGAFRRAAHEKKIGPPIAIVVKETCASARSNFDAASSSTLRHKRIRLRRKSHRNGRWHINNRIQRQLRERVSSLIAVARAERRSEMVRRDFLEARQVFARRSSIALPLKRARQAELRRSVKRRKRQPPLKRRDGFVIFLQLGVQ